MTERYRTLDRFGPNIFHSLQSDFSCQTSYKSHRYIHAAVLGCIFSGEENAKANASSFLEEPGKRGGHPFIQNYRVENGGFKMGALKWRPKP